MTFKLDKLEYKLIEPEQKKEYKERKKRKSEFVTHQRFTSQV